MKRVISQYSRGTLFLGDLLRRLPACLWWPLSWLAGEYLYLTRRNTRRRVHQAYRRLCEAASIAESPARLTRRFFHRQLLLTVAQYALMNAPGKKLDRLVEVEGYEQVEEALARQQGLVVMVTHIGAYLMPTAYVDFQGHKIANLRRAIMKGIDSQKVREMLFLHRDTVYLGDSETRGLRSPVREVIRKLRSNHVMGNAYDGEEGGREVNAPLFGGEVCMHLGALDVARMAHAPIVYSVCVIRNHRYYLRYFPVQTLASEDDINRFFGECMKQYEETIRNFPESEIFMRPVCIALGLEEPEPK